MELLKNNDVNIGIVGCGYWGPNLLRNFRLAPDCTVKYACDHDQERLRHIKKLYPEVSVVTSLDRLLQDEKLDAIAIATPVWTHFDLAKKSLEAGKHTFIEKPMASSTGQCRELINLAQSRGRTLMVGHTFIYSTPVRRIKEIVDKGDIGKLLYISSQRLNLGLFRKEINVAWDLAAHDISIILHIMGSLPVSVNCQGKVNINTSVEDVTNMSLNFENGSFATIQSSWIDPNKVRRMTFVGSNRMVLYDDTEPLEKIRIYDKRVQVPPHYDTFAEFQYSYHYGDMYVPRLEQVEPLKTECAHFIECTKNGKKPASSGLEGLQVVQILEAASASLKNGVTVEVPNLMTTLLGNETERRQFA